MMEAHLKLGRSTDGGSSGLKFFKIILTWNHDLRCSNTVDHSSVKLIPISLLPPFHCCMAEVCSLLSAD